MPLQFLLIHVTLVLLICCSTVFETIRLNPVIHVPGVFRSRLQVVKPPVKSRFSLFNYNFCPTEKYELIWYNASYATKETVDCFVQHMSLKSQLGEATISLSGAQLQEVSFGSLEGLEPLEKDGNRTFTRRSLLAEELSYYGYKPEVNLHFATYDFRLSPATNPHFNRKMKTLVEFTYEQNDNQRVTITSHSFGGFHALYFLQTRSQEWKDKYIKKFITISTPWLGTVSSIAGLTYGYPFPGAYKDFQSKLVSLAKSFQSAYFFLPNEKAFAGLEFTKIGSSLYTGKNLRSLISYLFPNTYKIFEQLTNRTNYEIHPGVDVICLHSAGMKTVEKINYSSFLSVLFGSPTIDFGDGDDTVNRVSLEGCKIWENNEKFSFKYEVVQGVGHQEIVEDEKVMRHFVKDYIL